MFTPRQIVRLLTIQKVLVRHGLDEFILATHLMRPVRFLRLVWPGYWWRRNHDQPRGARVRMALEELGPIFVKFGQALSTRRDILPLDIADELARLQDDVPAFSGDEARGIVEDALGASVGELFAEFDSSPLAAASIAQVHKATLVTGENVVVKVLRPTVRNWIERDIEILYTIARLAHRYWPEARRLRPVEVVGEYEKTIIDELDLMREAANAAQLRRNFDGSEQLYVPDVYWDYCRTNVVVLERISGIPIGNVAELKRRGTNFKKLAHDGVEIFFTQVFRHNFFHADMHPGNIFVNVEDPENPKYIAVDFGIVGSLTARDQHYLAENFLAFFNRDYYRVAKLHVDSGWVPPDTRIDELEAAVRTVCEPIFNKPLKDISFGQVLLRLFQTARRFNMIVQPQLILLQKTLLNIEGLGRELYPDLDLWETAQPILEEWVRDRVSGRGLFNRIREQLPDLSETLQEVPLMVQNIIQQAAEGRIRIQVDNPGIEELKAEVRRQGQKRRLALVGAAGFVGGILLIGLEATPAWLGWSLAGAALLPLVLSLRNKVRD